MICAFCTGAAVSLEQLSIWAVVQPGQLLSGQLSAQAVVCLGSCHLGSCHLGSCQCISKEAGYVFTKIEMLEKYLYNIQKQGLGAASLWLASFQYR